MILQIVDYIMSAIVNRWPLLTGLIHIFVEAAFYSAEPGSGPSRMPCSDKKGLFGV